MTQHAELLVQHLCLRGSWDDNPSLQLALSRLLDGTDLRPKGVPPSAVLIVRRLADPLPGRIAPSWRAVRVDAAWERAAQDALAGIYRRAARPREGYVAANDEAILFTDEAEMLACLALDMSRGEATQRWWWKAMLRTLPSPSAAGLTKVLCSKAGSVPAALHYLVEWRGAVTVLEALSPQQAVALLSAMGQAFGIADFSLGPTSSRPFDGLARGGPGLRSATQQTVGRSSLPGAQPSSSQPGLDLSVPTPTPPWSTATASWAEATVFWAGERILTHLGKERTCLLGVGLSLYDRPAVVRSSAFLRALRQWWVAPGSAAVRQAAMSAGMGHVVTLPQREAPEVIDQAAATGSTLSPRLDQTRAPDVPPAHAGMQEERAARQVLPRDGMLVSDISAQSKDDLGIARDTEAGGAFQEMAETAPERGYPSVQQASEAQRESSQQRPPGDQIDEPPRTMTTALDQEAVMSMKQEIALRLSGGVQTQVGGVLYLINLMRHLNLPGCFEADWGLGSQVGPWGLLDILGRSMLTDQSGNLHIDPLWVALAQLGGHEPGELPGAAFCGSEVFDLPVPWAAVVRDQEGNGYSWATDGQRLRLWSTQGYVVAERPRDAAAPDVQARQVLQVYQSADESPQSPCPPTSRPFDQAPLDPLLSPLVAEVNPNLARWLALTLPYIRFRLQQALSQGDSEACDLERDFLRQQGWLYVTSTHVDLVMSLNDVSLSVRLAGLDCDPGWLADFARVVLFHFE